MPYNEKKLMLFLSRISPAKHMAMLDACKSSLQKQMHECRDAFIAKDAAALKAAVHDVISVANAMEALELGTLAAQVEHNVSHGENEKAFAVMAQIFAFSDEILAVIEQKQKDLAST